MWDIENNTWAPGDLKFLFKCSPHYLMSMHSEHVRYQVEQGKRNSISPSNHVLFCLIYKHLRMHCHSFTEVNRVSDMSAADWWAQILEKLLYFFRCGDMVFLSGGNPYKALQFI